MHSTPNGSAIPRRAPWGDAVARRARVRGALLGGAVGDALGNPVEFLSLDGIRRAHGDQGVRGLTADPDGVVGRITDDTQMTLFTAEGLIRAHARTRATGTAGSEYALVRNAYRRWLDTQNHPAPPDRGGDDPVRTGTLRKHPWLYARRAPGNACLTGLAAGHTPEPGTPLALPGPVNPQSKGCGTVMRSAPFGLVGADAPRAFELAARCARITHGHPTGGYAAGAFAAIVTHLLEGDSPAGAVLRAMDLLARHRGHEETTAALRAAVDLAVPGRPSAEHVESLGAGWVAEEALAIAVYCALVLPGPDDVGEALLLSVNHSGDSDSTGSVCGNLLGAHHGDVALPASWLAATEGRAVIAELADDLCTEFGQPVRWPEGRYPEC
ncbi:MULTISPECIES: ADP-ribosylglycohydrolase family protein [Streptomyces]|uniref:ADP-ribosylglycohydrolase family protein n=1 Tax=Streptomyces salyersiae TaxID=3075530 RepID=A0ABU2RTX4_9ACTN|nr:ADP-ribosylglycohydrolase family protein [Streptomyces sp. DSM 41770]MDT0432292.1 ADP-ribosylglycohydrolase family protein [Streptomyces sp. DSM 41770]MYU35075.1 ADP-ribosylglycohydrolase family protein [Streptomyces sp. SID8358]